jgi:uncharacterized RDD family membrane protein YckC
VVFAPAPEYSTPGGRRLAEATDRLLARLIDGLILSIPALLIDIPIMVGLYFLAADLTRDVKDGGDVLLLLGVFFGAVAVMLIVNGVVSYLYEVIYMRRTGQTIGKRVMKIRVVRVEDGGPIAASHARRRWLANEGVALLGVIPLVGSIVSVYGWMNPLWLIWDKPNRQCLHDKYAKTTVVKLTPADLAEPASAAARAA